MSKAKVQENKLLALLRVLRAGQITLPADLRRFAGIHEGDYLQAEAVEGGVLLRPVSLQSREQAWNMIRQAQHDLPRLIGPGATLVIHDPGALTSG